MVLAKIESIINYLMLTFHWKLNKIENRIRMQQQKTAKILQPTSQRRIQTAAL
jgi:hypothetical protein